MSEYYKFIDLNVVTMLEIRDDIQLGTLILKNIFSILLFSVILLNGKCAIGATPSEILEQQSKLFEEGFDAARDCLRKLNAAQTLLQSPTDTTNGTEQISSETLNRDLNVYTTIGELGREFILEETSTQRKGKILNHLTILAYSHFLIPGTIIDKETKTNIFTKHTVIAFS